MKKQPKTRIVRGSSVRYGTRAGIDNMYTPQVKGLFIWRNINPHASYFSITQAQDAIDAYLHLKEVGDRRIIKYPSRGEI